MTGPSDSSDDGIDWTRHDATPVIPPGTDGAWKGLRVVAPSVHVTAEGDLVMAVHGQSATDAAWPLALILSLVYLLGLYVAVGACHLAPNASPWFVGTAAYVAYWFVASTVAARVVLR